MSSVLSSPGEAKVCKKGKNLSMLGFCSELYVRVNRVDVL